MQRNSAPVSLENLRAKIRALEGEGRASFFNETVIDSLPLSIPQGALVSVSGVAKTQWLAQLLAVNHTWRVAWIEESATIYPVGFMQHSIDLNRILFVEAASHWLWAAKQVADSQIFNVLILTINSFDEKMLRRLQIDAEKNGTTTFVLQEEANTAWPFTLSLHTDRHSFSSPPVVEVLRRRLARSSGF